MSVWKDFNNAEDQNSFDIIPKGTIARVNMIIKPGWHNDSEQGWTHDYATKGESGAVYLNCEFSVLEGPYAGRKIWSLIGLYSPKGPAYATMGRSFIKSILNSARGFAAKDTSPQAMAARRINGLGDLDSLEFIAKIDVEKNNQGEEKNVIKTAITKDHKDYSKLEENNTETTHTPRTATLPAWAK